MFRMILLLLISLLMLVSVLCRSCKGYQFRDLYSWLESQGGSISNKVEIRDTAGKGRGLFAVSNLTEGEAVVSLPVQAMLLSEDAVKIVPCSSEIEDFFKQDGGLENADVQRAHSIFSMMVFLLVELGRDDSEWGPYVCDLHQHWSSSARARFPLFWQNKLRAELTGTLALDVFTKGEESIAREYTLLQNLCPKVTAKHSIEEYQSVWSLVNSHILNYNGGSSTARGKNAQSAMLPIFDLVNHNLPMPHQTLKTDKEIENHYKHTVGQYGMRPVSSRSGKLYQLQLWAQYPTASGAEVTDVYGIKSNEDFLWTWGFTVPWIHNLTCLSTTYLSLQISKLPRTPRAEFRKRALIQYEPLRFRVNSCLGNGFEDMLAFARFWFADAADSTLRSECGFDGPPPWGVSSQWVFNKQCKHINDQAGVLRLIRRSVAAARQQLAGGSLKSDEKLLAKGIFVDTAHRDAIILRRDEKYVLHKVSQWLREEVNTLNASRHQEVNVNEEL